MHNHQGIVVHACISVCVSRHSDGLDSRFFHYTERTNSNTPISHVNLHLFVFFYYLNSICHMCGPAINWRLVQGETQPVTQRVLRWDPATLCARQKMHEELSLTSNLKPKSWIKTQTHWEMQFNTQLLFFLWAASMVTNACSDQLNNLVLIIWAAQINNVEKGDELCVPFVALRKLKMTHFWSKKKIYTVNIITVFSL